MDVILTLVRNEIDRRAIRAGTDPDVVMEPCERVAELHQRIDDAPVIAIISELTDANGADAAAGLAALHPRRPWLPIALYIALAPADVRRGADLVCRGIASGIIFRGIDDLRHTMRQLVARARGMAETARVVDALRLLLPPTADPVLSVCAAESVHPLSVEEVARALDVSTRTLAWQMHRSALPSPQRLISWCRLLRVALRLERPHTTTSAVAESLGYPSARALAMHLRRHTGLTPAKLKAAGGVTHLLSHIAATLRTDRDAPVAHDTPARRYTLTSDSAQLIRYISRQVR